MLSQPTRNLLDHSGTSYPCMRSLTFSLWHGFGWPQSTQFLSSFDSGQAFFKLRKHTLRVILKDIMKDREPDEFLLLRAQFAEKVRRLVDRSEGVSLTVERNSRNLLQK